MNEVWALVLFGLIFIFILAGFPVAFTLGGLSAIFVLLFFDVNFFYLIALRIYGTMNNFVLIAVPLFVYMGLMLGKSGLAESLLETMALLFGRFKGGLAVSVVLVGALLAASTGIVGATVITMGLISLPTMLRRGFSPELATGTIASAGTLGQIIPPSVVLVLLGSVLNVSTGDLFTAAIVPGVGLVLCYLAFIAAVAFIRPAHAPAMPENEVREFQQKGITWQIVRAFVLPLLLIVAVLGSIFAGIASPTEAAGVGALGASLLTAVSGRLSMSVLKEVMRETTRLTSMVFTLLIGATAFSLVFRALGGDRYLVSLIGNSAFSANGFLFMVMLVVFVAGFFIDFIEIIFIIVPVVAPVFTRMGFDLVWVGILLALNLQTSFLTPPFGFSLFYLKGVAPPEITTGHLYRGIVPYVIIQLLFLLLVAMFPEIVTFLPQWLKK